MKKSVLCIFGGKSTEYEVSLRSVCTVLEAIDREKYDVTVLGITKDGAWYRFDGPADEIRANTWFTDAAHIRRAMLSPNAGEGILYVEKQNMPGSFETVKVDVVIPVVHGSYAEDGNLQGLLSMSGIPYVGPHCAASAVGMDKAFTKLILNNYGIPQAKCAVLTRKEITDTLAEAVEKAEAVDIYPLFVKPANAGSSVGVSKAVDRAALEKALINAAKYDKKVLVEECIIGREVECAVLGNDDPTPSIPGEIASGADFYDYDAKYITDTSSDYIPARVSETTLEKVRAYAKTIYIALGCQGLSRVDFFVRADESIIFNEINTLPGFTSISMYPKLWNYMGKNTKELIDALIAFAEASDDR
ncbi:MAG: D-alanine--D-alanine ligase [Clostridia bacterium]|nr:D-alanine--D-alanine ligase [Clostridia bacterium]